MKKSKWKSNFVDNKLLNLILINKNHNYIASLKTQSRSSFISKDFINLELFIYNGIAYKQTLIKSNMIKQKIGQFHFTRKQPKHKKK